MKPNNFINLSVVFGFFLGLVFALAKFDNPETIFFCTLFSTLGFYLIILFCSSVYIWFVETNQTFFNKTRIDKRLEFFDKEFDIREREAINIRRYIQNADFLENKSSNDKK
ncbi:hypothetical protein [Helicobacter sp. 13S00477-4]|uniref:hypothetical protein n=1 Tax=Helicobacter sp. 13S00477-4 TaxID=1905759 RepID=UPI000BA65C76|nr:hypothetical protein [Helicobacter sp. 13S00477-4]PAF52693.1 hypothetical protein BKH44_00475 [Helicobacter sp. 13S00477-4]